MAYRLAPGLAVPGGRLAPSRFVVCVQYSTKAFQEDRWPLRYYAAIQGHELLTRRDLFPSEPDYPRAGNWYYALQLGPLEHKLPPIVAHRWRRVTFIVTTGDRFTNAIEINDLFECESPAGQLYVRLKELGIAVEREWWIDKQGIAYIVDLALPIENSWLPVTFGERPGPAGGLRFEAEACLRDDHICRL